MNRKILDKILAIMLVFSLTCANFILVAANVYEIYAANVEYESQNIEIDKTDVEFDAYFKLENGDRTHTYISEMENENLRLYLDISVKKGYLENAIVSIQNSNFKLKESSEIINGVEKISSEENIVLLNQISKGENIIMELPIEIVKDEMFNINNFSLDSSITLSGTFVNDGAKKIEFKKSILVNLSLSEEAKTYLSAKILNIYNFIENDVNKYFLQFEVESGVVNNALPIKTTELDIYVPELEDMSIEYISVYSPSTFATNGDNGDNFGEDNYTVEDNYIHIQVNNNINQDNFISWIKDSADNYIVNIVYLKEGEENKKPSNVELKINSKLSLYNSQEKTVNNEFIEAISLNDIANDITYVSISGNENISKGYMTTKDAKNTEFEQNIEVNIGYASLINRIDINIDKEVYKDERSKEYNATTFYKKISIGKENFKKILGEQGKIIILDNDTKIGELTIENLEFIFEDEISNINLEIIEPITEGKLNIYTEKYIKSNEYTPNIVNKLIKMDTTYKIKTDVSEKVLNKEVELKDAILQAKLDISQSNLSTVLENENVDIKIILQTSNNTQKLYKEPIVEVEFPSYITNIDLNSINLFYDSELLLDTAELITNSEGNKVLRLKFKGGQTKYNDNYTVEGATIVINANITVDKSAPSITQKINTKVLNDNNEEISTWTNIYYSAPVGIITLNTLSEFNNNDDTVTSISGEELTGNINKLAETKIAAETITVINNYDYTCGNMIILGRTPSEGNKNIRTNEDLGSTFTAKMVDRIKAVTGVEDSELEVYYSENSEATRDLNDMNNKWSKTTDSYEAVKSYLIIVNKQFAKGDKVVLSYAIEIPEGLSTDESTYSMFEVYYTNLDGALSGVEETTTSQVVGLATEESLNIDVNLSANVENNEEVMEGQIIEYTVTIKNNGNTELKNVKVSVDIPTQANITEYKYYEDILMYDYENLTKDKYENSIDSLLAGETKTLKFMLRVNGRYSTMDNLINVKAEVSVDSADNATKVSNEISNKIVEGYFELFLTSTANATILKNGSQIIYVLKLNKYNSNTYNNAEISCTLPNTLKFISSIYQGEDEVEEKITGNNLKWEFDRITSSSSIEIICEIQNLNEDKENIVSVEMQGKCDEFNGTIKSNKEEFTIGNSILEVNYTATNTSGILTDGDYIEYLISVKNIGNIVSYNTILTDTLTEGLSIDEIIVTYPNGKKNNSMSTKKVVDIPLGDIRPNETVLIKIIAKSYVINDEDTVVSNSYSIKSDSSNKTIENKSINYTVKPIVYDINDDRETVSKYSISGLAWEDTNKNGIREINEKILSQIPVLLLDGTGNTVNSTITDENGAYVFMNLNEGNYIVVFLYDTANYDVTIYNAENLELNNDTLQMNLNIGDTNMLCAATNAIKLDENKANIDLGLIISPKFDLSLTKTIKKITINTSKGTKSYDYNNSVLEKIEIPSSELNGANLAIEYEIKVTNIGAISGYAKKIVDYVSSTDLKFSSELNSDWYLGTDGNLYNGTLGNVLLKTGEFITLKLILTKTLNENNTGITSNIAEIYEAYNDEGIEDYNSTVANKAQTENDLGHADIIVAVKTGVVTYIGIVLFTIAILTFGVYILNKKVIKI